jgi:hypothetical protein
VGRAATGDDIIAGRHSLDRTAARMSRFSGDVDDGAEDVLVEPVALVEESAPAPDGVSGSQRSDGKHADSVGTGVTVSCRGHDGQEDRVPAPAGIDLFGEPE